MILLTIPGGHPWTVRTLPRNFVAWKWGAGEFADGKDGLTISQGLCQGWREVGWVVSKKNPYRAYPRHPKKQKKQKTQMEGIPTYTVDRGFGVSSEGYVAKFFRLLMSIIWVKVILSERPKDIWVFFFLFCSDFCIFRGSNKNISGIQTIGGEANICETLLFLNSLGVHQFWRPQRESQHGFPSSTLVPVKQIQHFRVERPNLTC